jgi:hypothetical protein
MLAVSGEATSFPDVFLASMSVARIFTLWPLGGRLTSEHRRSFTYEIWLGSGCFDAQIAKLHGGGI